MCIMLTAVWPNNGASNCTCLLHFLFIETVILKLFAEENNVNVIAPAIDEHCPVVFPCDNIEYGNILGHDPSHVGSEVAH